MYLLELELSLYQVYDDLKMLLSDWSIVAKKNVEANTVVGGILQNN
jgi:hypothetical protein